MDHRGAQVLNYRLTEVLGEGGHGTVYRAVHAELGREVAIKVLRAEHARDPAVVERFFREARLACTIGHPDIVEVENTARLESGEPCFVMELVNGRSLGDRIASDGRLSWRALDQVFSRLADVLTAAHDKGVLHRDLKPHNLMLREHGGEVVAVKLLDFGIAKLLRINETSSRTGGLLGTPHYMAPEQARDAKNVDARADLYGFAATFFHAVTGRRPFEADTITEVLAAVQRDPPPAIDSLRPDAPAALASIVARCLAKHPDDRPASVSEAWRSIRDAFPTGDGAVPPTLDRPAAKVARRPLGRYVAGAAALLGGVALWTFLPRQTVLDPVAVEIPRPVVHEPAPVVETAPPPVAETAPASVVETAPPPPPKRARTSRRVVPPPAPPPPVAAAAPEMDCTKRRFSAIYDAPSADRDDVQRALRDLRLCREGDRIAANDYRQIQAALVTRL